MNAADFAAMADPDMNWNFRRCWVDPPDPATGERGGPAQASLANQNNLNEKTITERALPEAMGARMKRDLFRFEALDAGASDDAPEWDGAA